MWECSLSVSNSYKKNQWHGGKEVEKSRNLRFRWCFFLYQLEESPFVSQTEPGSVSTKWWKRPWSSLRPQKVSARKLKKNQVHFKENTKIWGRFSHATLDVYLYMRQVSNKQIKKKKKPLRQRETLTHQIPSVTSEFMHNWLSMTGKFFSH